jgi:serine/threonine protein kinase
VTGRAEGRGAPREAPRPGDIIAGKYEVERVLGVGGMGVVVAARHVQLGHRVAVKFMNGDAANAERAIERFLREARAAAVLTSDHVARVIDVGTLESGAPYMVIEYLAGLDLRERLEREGPMPIPTAVDYLLQACDAIAEAHASGIVHRDLKPANLFLATDRNGAALVKVLDFGISKFNELGEPADGQDLTATGAVMGSPGYMSPEQVRSAKHVDGRSDIWSLGVILYELLTGVSPFQGETLGETLARIVSEDPAPIEELRRDVPPALAALVRKCLARRVDERVGSVRELVAALQPFAPQGSALLIARILRVDRAQRPAEDAPRSPGSVHTMTAPDGGVRSNRDAHDPGTGPAWQRSGERIERARGWSGIAMALVAGGLVVVAAGAGYWAAMKPAAQATSGGAGVVSAGAASAGGTPAPSAVVPPPVAAAISAEAIAAPAQAPVESASAAPPPRLVPVPPSVSSTPPGRHLPKPNLASPAASASASTKAPREREIF